MSNFIFHEPWWLLGLVAVGGIITFILGNRRIDKKLQRIGLALLALALLFAGLRFFFPTNAERMEIRTRQLVTAVDSRDWTRLRSLLDPSSVVGSRSHVIAGGAAAIVSMTQRDAEDFNVHSIRIIGMETTQTDTLITVAIEVFSVQDPTQGRPDTSSWQLDYEQSGDQWILDRITLLRLGSQNGEQNFDPLLGQ
jgi:hypothetical protein